jgi:hypothetical protein
VFRQRGRNFWRLLRDYRAGLLSDEEAHGRVLELRMAEWLAGNVDGVPSCWLATSRRRRSRLETVAYSGGGSPGPPLAMLVHEVHHPGV